VDVTPSPGPATAGSAPGTEADVSDAYLFERIVAFALAGDSRPATAALGLTRADLQNLVERHAPHLSVATTALPADAGPGEEALEEPDYRDFILEHRAGRSHDEEGWLAAIIARRSLGPNHLWQDLGLGSRVELNALLKRHFPALVRRNAADMKWKKFIYRQLCEREGVPICKAPNCAVCSDFADCFGAESGAPLVALAQLRRAED
jgi:nitrogen fixation protein NifQ